MKIIVCVKRVPDSAAKLSIAADEKSLDSQSIEYVINPYDEFAIEEAIKLKEQSGEGEIILVSVDPVADQTLMRKALAMGADRAIIIKQTGSFDALQTAHMLFNTIHSLTPDIILCGKQAIDDDNLQVPSMLAHLMGIPRVNVITSLEYADGMVQVNREVEGGKETYEVKLPAVFSAQKGLNEPRFPTLKGIMSAKKKPIEVIENESSIETLKITKFTFPADRPPGKIVGHGPEAVPELIRLLKDEAKVL